eukprot:45619-Eustigmatos_ZCMA.PRE.1
MERMKGIGGAINPTRKLHRPRISSRQQLLLKAKRSSTAHTGWMKDTPRRHMIACRTKGAACR